MSRCLKCGKIAGSHLSVMQGCRCQYSMQAPTPPVATQQEPVYKYCDDGKVIFTNPEILSRRPSKE